jgi:hypothetical protein
MPLGGETLIRFLARDKEYEYPHGKAICKVEKLYSRLQWQSSH